ncbi:ATP-binding protein [Mitsuaria sp. WAJ17]|uniref:AAA family ATPase n=1 Tax=Mitsuaria sp. WAJ17 TaxID=2761452 RepID=UPI0015FF44E5|nr:AAA family ATPase [Mitsuaria sp. WAJ17]MBB2485488.1 ATP-binding protein [Mitsuaria sp. WAJ17]
MLKSIKLSNFTVFREATVSFVPGINVIVGENGMGKSHLLKLAYSSSAVAHTWVSEGGQQVPKTEQQRTLADKLRAVFRPDSLGRLARRGSGRQRADVAIDFIGEGDASLKFSFATNSKTEVSIEKAPAAGLAAPSLFFPTKEVISMFPRFASLYRDYHIEIDETYYDLCLALERPLLKGRRYEDARRLLAPLEAAIGGTVSNANGRFVLSIPGEGNMEIPLVAEGIRKLATVAYLVANGVLKDKATLYWDEPETNLNPKLLSQLAQILVLVAAKGTQVILATHSLFLLRELDMCLQDAGVPSHFIALGTNPVDQNGVVITESDSAEGIDPIAALDAEITQSERYEQRAFERAHASGTHL